MLEHFEGLTDGEKKFPVVARSAAGRLLEGYLRHADAIANLGLKIAKRFRMFVKNRRAGIAGAVVRLAPFDKATTRETSSAGMLSRLMSDLLSRFIDKPSHAFIQIRCSSDLIPTCLTRSRHCKYGPWCRLGSKTGLRRPWHQMENSSERQGRSGLGLEAQQAAVANYLNGGDWRIVAEFTEVESGRRSDRPELDKALAAARLHRCPLVVSKVDRLTRSVAFLSRLLEAGVDVRFADLPQIQGATGRFLLQQMVAVAELEAGMISTRTKAALQAAKARGKALGGLAFVRATARQLSSADRRRKPVQQPIACAPSTARPIWLRHSPKFRPTVRPP